MNLKKKLKSKSLLTEILKATEKHKRQIMQPEIIKFKNIIKTYRNEVYFASMKISIIILRN